MINKDEVFELTQNGAQQLNDELEKLKTVDRVKIREAIKDAREQGDLSENADYASARERQAEIEARILEIENILKHAKIMEITKVTVTYIDLKRTVSYEVVGTIEADPFAGKISNDSPLGKAVSLYKPGDEFYITTESGKEIKLRLESIN
jgi:transcription elongation factor GreA